MRADKYFAERFGSRTKAAEAIERGLVWIDGQQAKPKDEVREGATIQLLQAEELFVSNGGYKLDRAVKTFGISCENKVFADIGASTGGFTDCLLQNGAKRVYAVDVGESLLHERIKQDERVICMDNTNARYLTESDFPESIEGIVTDVSFISLRLIFPAIQAILKKDGFAVVLIKPQFECENKNIGKSGIVHPSAHSGIVKKVLTYAQENGLYPFGIVNAPIRKGKNIEYVLYIKPQYTGAMSERSVLNEVARLVSLNADGVLK